MKILLASMTAARNPDGLTGGVSGKSNRCQYIFMLIITADDLGFSASRNAAILDAVAAGTVSSVSLMVNMPAAESACREIQSRLPFLSVGLHFTLTSGPPVAPPDRVPLLLDREGMFRHRFLSLWRHAAEESMYRQICIEFDAQYRRLCELAARYELKIDHLDSHQHIHAVRPIWKILEDAALRHDLPLRIPRETCGSLARHMRHQPFSNPVGFLKKSLLDFCMRNIDSPFRYFGVLDSGKFDWNVWRQILPIVRRHENMPCEVNVHPGSLFGKEADDEMIICSNDDRLFHRSPWRLRERDLLLAPEFLELLEEHGQYPLRTWKKDSA